MQEENYTVYRHIAPNGKMYVGITSQKPKKRWKNGRGYRSNQYFSNAINKYGWDNIKHEILLGGLTKEQAELAEQIFIAYWDLTNCDKGYNINHGGQVYGTHSKVTREKMSRAKKGKYLGENCYIQKCCAHKGKTAGGYCWEYYEEYTNKDTERRDAS